MNNYRNVIKAPIVTEKSASITSTEGKYVFEVDVKANKTQIRQAIEKLFNVKVKTVNTVNVHAKEKRVGRYKGLTNKYKKAFVTLVEGNKINL